MKTNSVKLFLDLVKISSPSGYETLVKEFAQKHLKEAGWIAVADKRGNLTAFKDAGAKLWLCAHMDTVQKREDIVKPVINKGIIKSDGTTILGADNKVGVAILLYLATKTQYLNSCGLIFTVNEESGEMGSSTIDLSDFKPKLILNLDGSSNVGVINDQGMGQVVFELEIFGKLAHAAKDPEAGVNAIKIAAKIINQTKLGKDSYDNTCNIGQIIGGGATNIVPDYVKMRGEMRSLNIKSLNRSWQRLGVKVEKICKEDGAKFNLIRIDSDGVPIWLKKYNTRYVNMLKKAADECQLKFKVEKMLASSDANFLHHWAPVFSINHGGFGAHSKEEGIAINDIYASEAYLKAIIRKFNKL